MYVQFVGPHFFSAKGLAELEDGVTGLDSATEGIAVGRKAVVVAVQEKGEEFEHACLVRTETVNGPFLASSHLVDALFFGNAGPFATDKSAGNGQIALILDAAVCIAEQGPGKTSLHQPVGQEFFPNRLVVQQEEEAMHRRKGKRGMILNQQNCCSPDGYIALPPARHKMGDAASSAGATGLHPLFPDG